MLIDRSHLSWALFSGITLIAGAVSYVAYVWNSPEGPSGGSATGLLFGVIGTLMMLFAGLLAARKPLRIRRIGSAKFWLKGHLWLGTLCIPFILFHSGFGWGGLLEQLLWYTLAIVAVSGFFGLAVQQFLPRLLWNRTPLETFEAQAPYQCDRMTFIADLRIAGLCESPLAVPPGRSGEHYATLVAGYNSIVNGPGARGEQNSMKLHLLQQVSPPEVRDFFWAMAKYAKSEAKAIRIEGDFPELLAKTYAGLKGTTGATSPQAAAPNGIPHTVAQPHALSPMAMMKTTAAATQPATANRPAATPEKSFQPTILEKQLLQRFYLDRVRPFLAETRSSRCVLKSPLASAVEARRLFHQQESALPATLHPVLGELEEFCEVRRQIELQRLILRWMHWWLMIHVPAAVALLIFLVAHIVMALRIIPFNN